MSLDTLFPQPIPVTIGGPSCFVGWAVCFQLRDLARLQRIVGDMAGDPLAGQRTALAGAKLAAGGDYLGDSPESRAFAALLRSAIAAGRGIPPELGSPEADRLLFSTFGLPRWLDTLLGRDHDGKPLNPGFTIAAAERFLPDMTAEEFARLQGIAYADTPDDEMNRLLGHRPRIRGKTEWDKIVKRFMADHPAYTLEEVGKVYLGQLTVLQGGSQDAGERGKRQAIRMRVRQLMTGEPGSNGDGHTRGRAAEGNGTGSGSGL